MKLVLLSSLFLFVSLSHVQAETCSSITEAELQQLSATEIRELVKMNCLDENSLLVQSLYSLKVQDGAGYGSCSPGRCQALARPNTLSPHGPNGAYWTHECYATAEQARIAAKRACERASGGYSCTARAYTATRCDR